MRGKWPITPCITKHQSVPVAIVVKKENYTSLVHLYQTAHSMSINFSSLNTYHSLMIRNPQSSSCELCWHSILIEHTPPLMMASISPHRFSILKSSLASVPETSMVHLAIICFQVFLNPNGLSIDFLSNPINLPSTAAKYSAHVDRWFPNHSVKSATTIQRSFITSLKWNI